MSLGPYISYGNSRIEIAFAPTSLEAPNLKMFVGHTRKSFGIRKNVDKFHIKLVSLPNIFL